MVLLCGIPADSPFEMIADALEEKKIPFFILNQHDYEPFYIQYAIVNGKAEGELSIRNQSVDLNQVTGIYNRMTDVSFVPEYKDLGADDPGLLQVIRAHETLSCWISITTARVLNQNRAMATNSSKPYQMMLIEECGFKTPRSIITNQPDEVVKFQQQWGRLIYKSASGVRSIVQELKIEEPGQLKGISTCPILFQQLVVGVNIRVHIAGNKLFATKVNTNAVDYRYAHKYGKKTELEACRLPAKVRKQCFALSERLKLPLTGIDLLHTPDDEWYCFEANPNPGFSYFEHHTGQPISKAIADYLAGN
jgi:hypothetical protein